MFQAVFALFSSAQQVASCSAISLRHCACLQACGVGSILDPDIGLSGIFASPRDSAAARNKDGSTSSSSAASAPTSPRNRPKTPVKVSHRSLLGGISAG